MKPMATSVLRMGQFFAANDFEETSTEQEVAAFPTTQRNTGHLLLAQSVELDQRQLEVCLC